MVVVCSIDVICRRTHTENSHHAARYVTRRSSADHTCRRIRETTAAHGTTASPRSAARQSRRRLMYLVLRRRPSRLVFSLHRHRHPRPSWTSRRVLTSFSPFLVAANIHAYYIPSIDPPTSRATHVVFSSRTVIPAVFDKHRPPATEYRTANVQSRRYWHNAR